jgi:hypothetical protein
MDKTSWRSNRVRKVRIRAGLATLACVLLAGCFGGDSDTAATPPVPTASDGDVPVGALATAAAYAQFVGAQASDDRRAPLVLGTTPAPASETDAPIPVL